MYSLFLKLRKWSKKAAETRRRNCAVLPKKKRANGCENRKEIKPGSAWQSVTGSISAGHWQFQQFLMHLFIHTAQLTCFEKSSILFLRGSVKKITL